MTLYIHLNLLRKTHLKQLLVNPQKVALVPFSKDLVMYIQMALVH